MTSQMFQGLLDSMLKCDFDVLTNRQLFRSKDQERSKLSWDIENLVPPISSLYGSEFDGRLVASNWTLFIHYSHLTGPSSEYS